MMLKVDQFCSLVTNPSWQAWLYKFDAELYTEFAERLRAARSCSDNREVMASMLPKIEDRNGKDQLIAFLRQSFPHVIDEKAVAKKADEQYPPVFEHTNSRIISYPRRVIFDGDTQSLKQKILQFTIDKPKHDSIIIKDKAYVEYLRREDMQVAHQIPLKNWKIAEYRIKYKL
jgi:hypothetical protein